MSKSRDKIMTPIPLSLDQMLFALNTMKAAHSGQMASPNPSDHAILLEDEEDGSVDELRFTDTPLNRSFFALREVFKDQPDVGHAATARVMVLLSVLHEPIAQRWSVDDGERIGVSEALVQAAGETEFTPQMWQSDDWGPLTKAICDRADQIKQEWEGQEG